MFQADSIADDEGEDNSSHEGLDVQTDHAGAAKKDDWDFAIRYRDIQRLGYLDAKTKVEQSEKAIRKVIDRAREILGPIQKPYRYIHVGQEDLPGFAAQAHSAELDIEETLLSAVGAIRNAQPIYQLRLEKEHGIVVVLDTSLSMKGEKLALLGVTAAVVALSLPSESFAILGFDSQIHAIKTFQEKVTPEQVVERVLSIPPGGFTNIHLGLNTARTWIEQSKLPQARVILVSDGRYTEGKNPVDTAKGMPFVYSVKIGKDPTGRQTMRDIADQGSGRFTEVREMVDLPRTLLQGIRSWVR